MKSFSGRKGLSYDPNNEKARADGGKTWMNAPSMEVSGCKSSEKNRLLESWQLQWLTQSSIKWKVNGDFISHARDSGSYSYNACPTFL